MRKYCDIIEPKLVVKLQPFGTERVIQIEVPGQAMKPQERIVVVLVH